MGKPELVAKLSEVLDLSIREADEVVSAFVEHVTNALARGESVNLTGFGAFTVKSRAERNGRNPKTQEVIVIPAHNLPNFKAGKALKDAVAQEK